MEKLNQANEVKTVTGRINTRPLRGCSVKTRSLPWSCEVALPESNGKKHQPNPNWQRDLLHMIDLSSQMEKARRD